jgi:hypothetical protein
VKYLVKMKKLYYLNLTLGALEYKPSAIIKRKPAAMIAHCGR